MSLLDDQYKWNKNKIIKKVEIVKADSVDEANIICKWATMFQRTEDWEITNNWICSTFIHVVS